MRKQCENNMSITFIISKPMTLQQNKHTNKKRKTKIVVSRLLTLIIATQQLYIYTASQRDVWGRRVSEVT